MQDKDWKDEVKRRARIMLAIAWGGMFAAIGGVWLIINLFPVLGGVAVLLGLAAVIWATFDDICREFEDDF